MSEMYRVRVWTRASRTPRRPRTWRWGSERRWARRVGAEQASLGQGPGIAPVGLDLAGAGGIHGGEVGVGDDDLVAEGLETAGHPFAVGRGLDQDPGAGPGAEHGGEALGLGADAPLDDLTALGEDVDLAFLLVHVEAN